MRQRLKLLAYFAIFWISFQIIIRAVFLLYNYDYAMQLTAVETWQVFRHGIRMDLSMGGYFLMLTGLVLTLSIFNQSKWFYLILNFVSIFLLLFSSIIVIVDLELYRHWGFRMDTTPFLYAGKEAVGSVAISVVVKLMLILMALFTAPLFVYSLWLNPKLASLRPATRKKSAIVLLIVTALMFIPIRGSFSVAPMNTGFVYFHKTKPFANHAAINVVWNFLYSLQRSGKTDYPRNFFDQELTSRYVDSLYQQSDSAIHVFDQPRPNIILFVLESFTADIIAPLGGLKNIAPNMDQLCSEGILFDHFYASGDRTDKGLVSILSAYPAQPLSSIVKYPAKTQHLPYLNHSMAELGYHTSFVYGGDIDFANFRSYLTNCRFDHLTTVDDFPDEDQSKWGVHDHIVFQKAFQECDTSKAPFFKVILSLSSHEPFDVPMKPFIKGQDDESLFLNACHYTDQSIGTFIQQAKGKPWWQNTVVIFVADHGHLHPGNKPLMDKRRFRIPLLMVGGAIKQDTVIHTVAGQTDIANTLLAQLRAPDHKFQFSKNILSPDAQSFAAFFFNNGYGFVTPGATMIFDNASHEFVRKNGASPHDLDVSKAYQQKLYLDYNER